VDEYFKTGLLRPGRSRYYYYRRASDISYNSRAMPLYILFYTRVAPHTHTHTNPLIYFIANIYVYRPQRMYDIHRLSHTRTYNNNNNIMRYYIIIYYYILSGPIYGAEQRKYSDAII